MSDTHPVQVYALLRQLRDGTDNPEYLAHWARWHNDKTEEVEPAQHEANYETWASYCRDNGLVEYEEWCGGQELTITQRGRGVLLLREGTPESTSGQQAVAAPKPQQPQPNPTVNEMPWENGGGWAPPQGQTARILRYMWSKQSVTWADFAEQIWWGTEIKENTVRGALNKANNYLERHQYSRTLSKVTGESLIRWV